MMCEEMTALCLKIVIMQDVGNLAPKISRKENMTVFKRDVMEKPPVGCGHWSLCLACGCLEPRIDRTISYI